MLFVFTIDLYSKEFINIIKQGEQYIIEITPSSKYHLNCAYKVDNIEKEMNISKILINNKEIILSIKDEDKKINLNEIAYIKIYIDENFDNNIFENIRKISSFQKKIKYKDPVILNSWITIDNKTYGKMIKEFIIIENFLIFHVKDYHIHIYPYSRVDKWTYNEVDSTPEDIVRDFINDTNRLDNEEWFKQNTTRILLNNIQLIRNANVLKS